MTELYNILSIFVSCGLFLTAGLMLLFVVVPGSPLLANYRKARYMMAIAYLFFACMNLAEYFMAGSSESDVPLMRTIILIVAASQAVLFTFGLLALLETRFPGWRYIFCKGIPALLLIAATATVYATCPETTFRIAFWGFAGIYTLLLACYTLLFVRIYRRFRRRMDNYFSDNEAGRLRWIVFSWSAALVVGIGALVTSVFVSTAVALGFAVVFDIFYTWFAIRFINYAHRFHVIEAAMENDPAETAEPTANFARLEQRIERWVADKGYTEKGITIAAPVPRLYTNRHYLSAYINTCKGCTFRAWINDLRIEEARRLLAEHPDMTVGGIARQVGFSDKSNFIRLFTARTGHSPKSGR